MEPEHGTALPDLWREKSLLEGRPLVARESRPLVARESRSLVARESRPLKAASFFLTALLLSAGCVETDHSDGVSEGHRDTGSSVGALTCAQSEEIYESCRIQYPVSILPSYCDERYRPGMEYLCGIER